MLLSLLDVYKLPVYKLPVYELPVYELPVYEPPVQVPLCKYLPTRSIFSILYKRGWLAMS